MNIITIQGQHRFILGRNIALYFVTIFEQIHVWKTFSLVFNSVASFSGESSDERNL